MTARALPRLVAAALAATGLVLGCNGIPAAPPAQESAGLFNPCPAIERYGPRFQAQVRAEYELLPQPSAIGLMLEHYRALRLDALECHLAVHEGVPRARGNEPSERAR